MSKAIRRFWRHNKELAIGIPVLALATMFSWGDIQKKGEEWGKAKAIANENAFSISTLEQQVELEKAQSDIAVGRYKSGCLPIVANVFPHKYITLVKGKVIKDRITKAPLPAGTVVCDANGNTGVIDERGAPDAIAFTGNRDAILLRLNRFRGGTFSQPVSDQKGEKL